MTLLQEIQRDAVDPNVEISTLLRKCKILATRLKNEQFKLWVDQELNGYTSEKILPSYRILNVQSLGDFSGMMGSGLRNAPIPSALVPEKWREIATTAYLTDGIGSYASLVKEKKESMLASEWPGDLVMLVSKKIMANMSLMRAWRYIPPASILGLIDTVRNRVLSFVLEIESEAPTAGELQPNEIPIPAERVTQIYPPIF